MNAVCKKLVQTGYKLSPLAVAVMLSACGGTGQDAGVSKNSASGQTFTGLAIDGELARARVYLDTNNNATRDAWEAFAFTDNEGYYGYNPNTDTDYCADDATEEEQVFCLKTSSRFSNVVVRVDGGYDLLTGEPFLGQLSRKMKNIDASAAKVDTKVITPITTLLADVEDEESSTVLSNLGLTEDDIDINYVNDQGSGEPNTRVLNAALKVHKVATVIGERLKDNYTAIGEQAGTANDASSFVYKELGKVLKQTGNNIDTVMDDDTQVRNVFRGAESRIRATLQQRNLDLPTECTEETVERTNQVARGMSQTVNRLIDRDDTSLNSDSVRGASRIIESLVIKANSEEGDTDKQASLNNAFDLLGSFIEENREQINNLVTALAGDRADVSALANFGFQPGSFNTPEEAEETATVGEDAEKFVGVGGKTIRVSDMFLGYAPDGLRDLEFEVYFDGDASATSGSFKACAKYIENAHIDGTLGEGNTRGELVSGHWSMLGAQDGTSGSYNLLFTLKFLGENYSASMKSVGKEMINDIEYRQIRFDNGDDYRVWHSLGLQDTEFMPTTAEDCQQQLPSRLDF